MQRSNNPSAFEHASMEQLMERYRAELLSYQRATPPGKPTLTQMREGSAKQARPMATPAPMPAPMPTHTALPTPPVVQPEIVPAIPNPTPLTLTETRMESVPSSAKIAGIAASIAEDFTAGIFAAAEMMVDTKPIIVAEAISEETVEEKAEILEQTTATNFKTDTVIASMRETLAESLSDISMAGTARFECPGCRDSAQEQMENAPTRRRVLLPDENAELPTCPCGLGDPCPEILTEPPTPAIPMLPSKPLEEMIPPQPLPPIPPPSMLTKPTPPPVEPCEETTPTPPRPQIPPPFMLTKPTPPPADCLCCGHTEYEKCIGAYGTFQPYEKLDHLTHAAFLQKPGEAVEVLARFAADLPDGGADACRCRRSFSVKFFCKNGEYDLLGQHLPVTVGCEQQSVLACCSTTRADPVTGLRSRSRFWEYVAQNPMALHAAVWLYSDLGTIGSYRAIDGYASPSIWVGPRGKKRIARCSWLSRLRPQTLTRFESEELCGYDPDAVARDFVTAINRGEFPQYELAVQLLDPEQELPFDPYDPTLIWPQEIATQRRIGLMTLNRLPERISPELDAQRFSAEHLINGIEAAPPALPAEGREMTQAGNRLQDLSERERRRLLDNLCDELSTLPADLLEQILILFSKADLGFGQALTTALGG